MCGIAGFILKANETDISYNLSAGIRWMNHRGPDENGIWEEGCAGLGHSRLSIIDLAGGHQPMTSVDGRYVITFNGEIYNFKDIRQELEALGEKFASHSDTEILLRLFVREGLESCLDKLRGMFAFAVWDRHEQVLYLARDRMGVKPLVYAETATGFLFASEIGALFQIDATLSRKPDYVALDHYLTFQYIPSPLSGFAAIRKLPPAHAMKVRSGRLEKLWCYWDIDFTRRSEISFDDACEEVRQAVLEATRLRLVSDVPFGAFLSGGIDSSITVAAMTQLGAAPVKTFAIGFEEEKFNELPYARQIASHLSTDHHELIVRADAAAILPRIVEHLGEPMADSSAIPTYYVSKFTREKVTVALTGDGGDELFAGYRRYYHAGLTDALEERYLLSLWRMARRSTVAVENLLRPKKNRPPFPATRADQMLTMKSIERYKHLIAYFTDKEKDSLLTPGFKTLIGESKTSDYLTEILARASKADAINRYLYLDAKTFLAEDILFKVDICSMLNSLECRSPFLDHKLTELVTAMPAHFKLKPRHRHKHLLKEAFREWLPEGFMDRRKMGFSVPMEAWLRNELKPMMVSLLVEQETLSPWIRQEAVKQMAEEHLAGKDHSKRLWALMVLAEWVKIYSVPV